MTKIIYDKKLKKKIERYFIMRRKTSFDFTNMHEFDFIPFSVLIEAHRRCK